MCKVLKSTWTSGGFAALQLCSVLWSLFGLCAMIIFLAFISLAAGIKNVLSLFGKGECLCEQVWGP